MDQVTYLDKSDPPILDTDMIHFSKHTIHEPRPCNMNTRFTSHPEGLKLSPVNQRFVDHASDAGRKFPKKTPGSGVRQLAISF